MSAVNTNGMPTLVDMVKMMNPDGSIAVRIAELMEKRSELVARLPIQEANSPFGHRVTTRTALPTPTWRRYNKGIPVTNSREDQFTEACGMLRDWSDVDVELAEVNGNAPAFRMKKDLAKFAAMKIETERAAFYAATAANPEQPNGLAPRFNASTAADGQRVLLGDAAAAGNDQTSIWLLGLSPETVYGVFPKGGKGGLRTYDMGILPVNDGSGNPYRAYRTELAWDIGFVVEDYRFVARIANVDTGNLTSDASSGTKLIDKMIQATHRIYDLQACNPVFFCNRRVREFLQLQAIHATSYRAVTVEDVSGSQVVKVSGIPVVLTDAILSTEAPIS